MACSEGAVYIAHTVAALGCGADDVPDAVADSCVITAQVPLQLGAAV